MPNADITGFVLAGGQSTRMGRNKAFMPWGDGTMLSHACRRLQQVASSVFVVGGLADPAVSVAVLPDAVVGCGPLAGLDSALRHTDQEWNLVLAVDLPLVSVDFLRFVAELSGAPETLAVAARVGGQLQPLCAVYHRKLIDQVEQRLQSGNVSIQHLLESVPTRIIEEPEFLAAGFSAEMLLNVNTPEDLHRARTLAKSLDV